MLEDGLLDIDAVVEEEILLSLPLVAMHPAAMGEHDRAADADTDAQQIVPCELDGVYRVNDDAASTVNAAIANANLASVNGSVSGQAETIERRSDLGMNNPFDVLKTLKADDGQ